MHRDSRQEVVIQRVVSRATWTAPPEGMSKTNLDATFNSQLRIAEVLAIHFGLIICVNNGLRKLLVESDSLTAINLIWEGVGLTCRYTGLCR
ncbi:hypothetical protein REPUB_Repub13aG0152500 [Reevesia pubescens]